jgi:predicted amino acid-binding ACT domain protein
MTISVQRIHLWRGDAEDRPGILATTLEKLGGSGAFLEVIMGYSYPGDGKKAVIELFPVTGTETASAAQQVGLAASVKPTLLIQGDDRAGLSDTFYRAIAKQGINIDFVVAQAVGDHFSVVIGFATDQEADRVATLMKKMAEEPTENGDAEKAPN